MTSKFDHKFLQIQFVIFLRKNHGQRYTAREIAEWVAETQPGWFQEKERDSKGARPTLNQIAAEIGSYRKRLKNPNIKVIKEKFWKFYYTEINNGN